MENMLNIYRIGFAGKMGSGKTTLANYILRNKTFGKLSFADGARYTQKRLFPNRDNDRKLLQDIGMKMREIDENVWINQIFEFINIMDKQYGKRYNYVIDDVRFINEVNALIEHDWKIIKLECPKEERVRRLALSGKPIDRIDTHPSETELDFLTPERYPMVSFVDSNKSLVFLEKEIDEIVKNIKTNAL